MAEQYFCESGAVWMRMKKMFTIVFLLILLAGAGIWNFKRTWAKEPGFRKMRWEMSEKAVIATENVTLESRLWRGITSDMERLSCLRGRGVEFGMDCFFNYFFLDDQLCQISCYIALEPDASDKAVEGYLNIERILDQKYGPANKTEQSDSFIAAYRTKGNKGGTTHVSHYIDTDPKRIARRHFLYEEPAGPVHRIMYSDSELSWDLRHITHEDSKVEYSMARSIMATLEDLDSAAFYYLRENQERLTDPKFYNDTKEQSYEAVRKYLWRYLPADSLRRFYGVEEIGKDYCFIIQDAENAVVGCDVSEQPFGVKETIQREGGWKGFLDENFNSYSGGDWVLKKIRYSPKVANPGPN